MVFRLGLLGSLLTLKLTALGIRQCPVLSTQPLQLLCNPFIRQFPSNFDLLHLAYEALFSTEILWIISTYCSYVWNEKVQNGNNYSILVDKLRSVMMQDYQLNLISQNSLAFIPF